MCFSIHIHVCAYILHCECGSTHVDHHNVYTNICACVFHPASEGDETYSAHRTCVYTCTIMYMYMYIHIQVCTAPTKYIPSLELKVYTCI